MGQDRKEWESEGDVFLEVYHKEIKEDAMEEMRLFYLQLILIAIIATFCITREVFYPSEIEWLIYLKGNLQEIKLIQ